MPRFAVIVALFTVFTSSVGLVFLSGTTYRRPELVDYTPISKLKNSLSHEKSFDLPLADTESLNKSVAETLGYDDYLYRRFQTESASFTVYIAYWTASRRHFTEIGTHVPDNCWITAGWQMEAKLGKFDFSIPSVKCGNEDEKTPSSLTQNLPLWPAEYRHFSKEMHSEYVVYWHLVDATPINYARYGEGKTMGYIFDNVSRFWPGTGEQYFVRISSSVPMEILEENNEFECVLNAIASVIPLCRGNTSS